MMGKGSQPREPKKVMSYMMKLGNRILNEEEATEEKEDVALPRERTLRRIGGVKMDYSLDMLNLTSRQYIQRQPITYTWSLKERHGH